MGFEIESEKKTTIFFFNRKKCYSMREREREREREAMKRIKLTIMLYLGEKKESIHWLVNFRKNKKGKRQ